MSEIAARIGAGISRWFFTQPPQPEQQPRGSLHEATANAGKQAVLQPAETDIVSAAARVWSARVIGLVVVSRCELRFTRYLWCCRHTLGAGQIV